MPRVLSQHMQNGSCSLHKRILHTCRSRTCSQYPKGSAVENASTHNIDTSHGHMCIVRPPCTIPLLHDDPCCCCFHLPRQHHYIGTNNLTHILYSTMYWYRYYAIKPTLYPSHTMNPAAASTQPIRCILLSLLSSARSNSCCTWDDPGLIPVRV